MAGRAWGAGRRVLVAAPRGARVEPVPEVLSAAGFRVEAAQSEQAALEAMERGALAAAFVAQALGPLALGAAAARLAQEQPGSPVIVLGASPSVQDVVDAMQHGAADFLALPIDPAALEARLRALLDRAAAQAAPVLQPGFMGIVGSSPALRRVLDDVEKISRYKTNVLLSGESGTGKEIIARALHARGPRRQHLFVPLNCATLGKEILENELFGHEKGAFTGADERKQGLFELADGGTLFLDEIAEMDPGTQAKLLRVLERNEFRRVGGTAKVKVDLSVIAATNRRLEDALRAGRLREDLYYRLKVVTLVLPPLRERKEDIPALIEAFIASFNQRHGGKIHGISPRALKLIMEYPWPGNVRELKNAIESAAILASGATVGPEAFADLAGPRAPAEPRAATASEGAVVLPVGSSLAQAERELILATLRRHPKRAEAARVLGIGLRTLYTKLKAMDAETAP